MIKINGIKFYRKPLMCGECAAFLNGSTERTVVYCKGTCLLFDKEKGYYSNIPKRCERLIGKGMGFPDGTELVIVAND
ncbi:MAG: hypothetical protein HUK04_04175 [Bacteroidaceae bacterium]|nr:hypothetical protein [Bacteroidaceae bacterium]MCF0188670.1 hypothetical protein [Bacteroidaceae bacterium]